MIAADIRRFFSDRDWREDRVAAYASVGILFFLTSFFWAPTRDFMHVVYGLSFFAPVLLVLLLRKPNFDQYGGWFTGLGLLYAGYAAISTFWSAAPRFDFFAQHLLFLAVWLAGTSWLASQRKLDATKLYRVLIIAGAIASIAYQVAFHFQGYPLSYETELKTRLGSLYYGVIRNPNGFAVVFGSTTLLAYIWWLQGKGWRECSGRFALLLVNASAVLAAQSRGPILALAFALGLGFALYRGPSRKWLTHGSLAVLALGTIAVASQQDWLVSHFQDRVNSRAYRPQIWEYVVDQSAKEHLLLGAGLPKTTRLFVPSLQTDLPFVQHAHNAYIDAFYWTGLVGLLLMLAHMAYVLRHWSNAHHLLPLFLWFAFGCLTAVVDRPGFFEHLNTHWFVYWIPAGLIGALVMAEKQKIPPA
jgi:hypothetical protein